MKFRWLFSFLVLACLSLQGAVPELESRVPSATGYELICKLEPQRFSRFGYQKDNSETFLGDLARVGYLLVITDGNDKESWVFTSMEPFTKNIADLAIPVAGSPQFQCYVNDLEVVSNTSLVKSGRFAKGNVEIWAENYAGQNAKNISGANDSFDFGDKADIQGNFGSFQVHNYLEKETVFAFNNAKGGMYADLGIGNGSPSKDWTHSKSAKHYKSAMLYIVAKINNMTINEDVKVDPNVAKIIGKTDKSPLSYLPNEEMVFTLTLREQKEKTTQQYSLKWSRTGDDGKVINKIEPLDDNNSVTIKTSLDRPGFVRIYAVLLDEKGRNVGKLSFEGGAAVQPELLKGGDEPKDFDEFWQKQRAKLDTVPVKAEVKVVKVGKKVTLYRVKVDCYGPQPVTGHMLIPNNAKERSLAAKVVYMGYGFRGFSDLGALNEDQKEIYLSINAHGYDLARDQKYYDDFAEKIKSNGKAYAFDTIQNSDPETAYFNGMAMRVMRSLDFIKTRPEWDGKNLTVLGGSQGGLQTIWAAMLDRDVSLALPNVQWCCDMAGASKFQRLSAGWRIPYVPALEYYDPIFCASRIKCPVETTRAGLGDYVCPPSGLAIFYNNLKSPKKIVWVQGSSHGYTPPEKYRESVVFEKK